jgi:hypothetical protein
MAGIEEVGFVFFIFGELGVGAGVEVAFGDGFVVGLFEEGRRGGDDPAAVPAEKILLRTGCLSSGSVFVGGEVARRKVQVAAVLLILCIPVHAQ